MQIALERIEQQLNSIRSYSSGSVEVSNKVYHESIIIMPKGSIQPWQPQTYQQLTASHFEIIAEFKPQIVLLGTGNKLILPSRELRLAWQKMSLVVEYMDTAAACRTYNLLITEDRHVIAALLLS